jgi:hypothetical protein
LLPVEERGGDWKRDERRRASGGVGVVESLWKKFEGGVREVRIVKRMRGVLKVGGGVTWL